MRDTDHTPQEKTTTYKREARKVSVKKRKKFTEYLLVVGLFTVTGIYLAFSPLFPN